MKHKLTALLFLFIVLATHAPRASVTLTQQIIPLPVALCDETCVFSITFPEGGSVTAVNDDVVFEFGEGGYIDDGTVTTGYTPLDPLFLYAGDTLVFGAGGSIDLGLGGNIQYNSISVTTTGVVTIEATGGTGAIRIQDAEFYGGVIVLDSDAIVEGTLSLYGDVTVTANSILENIGTITGDGVITGEGGVFKNTGVISWTGGGSTNSWNDPDNWQYVNSCDATGGTLTAGVTISSTGAVPASTDEVCIGANTNVNVGTFNTSGGLTLTGGTTITPDFTIGISTTIDSGAITRAPADGVFVFDPIAFAFDPSGGLVVIDPSMALCTEDCSAIAGLTREVDGVGCTFDGSGYCVTEDGTRYKFDENFELVEVDGAGKLDLFLLAMLLVLIKYARTYSVLRIV